MKTPIEKTQKENKPIVIMGPTASGKTELALYIAKKCGGEIISADSRQVYKYLFAGTAKPHGRWILEGSHRRYIVDDVPYYLADIIEPNASFDAGMFVSLAEPAAAYIQSKNKIPIFTGGTGLYIQAYWNGLDTLPKASPQLRKEFYCAAMRAGKESLYERLKKIDPAAAEKIPPANIQRVMRALEVYELTGTPISKLWTNRFYGALPVHKARFVIINWDRELLRERISTRTQAMFDEMIEETKKLLSMGFAQDCPALKSLGYPQALDYISGKISKSEAVHKIISLTNAYAKRQITWLRRYKNAKWLDIKNPSDFDKPALADKILYDR
ncbi:MAG: tRNA (adenosine(37)-N6)-dimethylallyltransferase MiaA [Elusimicrobia bacterium]|nr:tRNA (adenosine(37)-N6)-dimethylallyltransferase MiaA [Elusimicrobiota bacterium]